MTGWLPVHTEHLKPERINMRVPYNYLTEQFAIHGDLTKAILGDIKAEAGRGFWTLGPQVQLFEEAWAEYTGAEYAVGVSSGTDALFLLLKAHGIGQGDTVATVPNTFLATVGAILQAGAEVEFVDIGDDYCIDWSKVDLNDGPNALSAVIPVHWGGRVAGYDVPEVSSEMPVIEDAAQAIGARYDGEGLSVGDTFGGSAFSLHPLKNINVWGDGGMVTTNDREIADRIRLLRNHGLEGRDVWKTPGYNMRLSTMQAIVGLHVLPLIDEINDARRKLAAQYNAGLSQVEDVILPPPPKLGGHAYHLYQVEVTERRDELIEYLNGRGIDAKVHYPIPLHRQLAVSYVHSGDSLPRATHFAVHHITLPIHQYLTEDQIDYTVEAIHEFYR